MIYIKNGKIFTMEGNVLEKGSMLIDDGIIKAVGENIMPPDDAYVIEAEGKIVMPGFIDAHTHLGMQEDSIGFEGDDVNENADPVTPELRAIDAINPMDVTLEEAYMGGVTSAATGPGSANVIGGQFAIIKTYGHKIDDMIIKESAAMKCAFGENPKIFYGKKGKSPSTRMTIAAILRENLLKAEKYNRKLKIAGDDETKKPSFDMKMEALLPVIRREMPLKAHVHRADDIFTAMRIAKEFGVKMTLDHCTDGALIAEDLKKEKENFDFIVGPSFGHRTKFELKQKSFKTPAVLSNGGLKIAICTDSPVVPLQHLPLCAALAVKSGMDEIEALKAITIYPAQILGIDNQVGSLKVGKDADVVIWDSHPFNIFSEVELTIINGKIIYKKN